MMHQAVSLRVMVAALGLGWCAPAIAQSTAAAPVAQVAQAPANAESPFTDAEVRRVDRDAMKITLRHGAIRNLDMPPMTMVFQLKDATLLEKFKAGDKVRFKAEIVNGAYIVTAIEAAP